MQQQQRCLQFQQRRLRGNIVNFSCSELSATALRAYAAAAAASRALASVTALRAYAAAATSRASASATALPAYAAAT